MASIEEILVDLGERLIGMLLSIPECVEFEPVPCVFELHTERDDIELLGRVNIIEIRPGGKLYSDQGDVWELEDVYSPADLWALLKVATASLQKTVKELEENEGFNKEE